MILRPGLDRSGRARRFVGRLRLQALGGGRAGRMGRRNDCHGGPSGFRGCSWLALKIAEPYLLEELATQGAGASRRNAGAFGRAVTQAPLFVTLLWGVVLAAVTEELMFRGALFGAVQAATKRLGRASGIIAIVVAAVAFGAMHADMKGSVGIVRVVSTTCLGLAARDRAVGERHRAGLDVLHFTYNTISLGIGRGWFVRPRSPSSQSSPTHFWPSLPLVRCLRWRLDRRELDELRSSLHRSTRLDQDPTDCCRVTREAGVSSSSLR